MHIDRIYQPVTTLGPGTRIAVWTMGCSKRCPGCANPELWEADPARNVPTAQLARLLLDLAGQTGIHRLTFTGGDPLEQPDELICVLEAVRPAFDDVLVYTGYTVQEAYDLLGHVRRLRFAAVCDVLIDGPYIEARNDGACPLRGSTNQRVLVGDEVRRTKPALARLYDEALAGPRRVQNAMFGGRSMSIGIHGRPGAGTHPGMPSAPDAPATVRTPPTPGAHPGTPRPTTNR